MVLVAPKGQERARGSLVVPPPQGSGRKGKPGRPKGTAKVSLKGYVKVRKANRIAKAAVKAFQAKLPKLIKKELKKLLR